MQSEESAAGGQPMPGSARPPQAGDFANALAQLMDEPAPPLVSVIIRSVGRAELAVALDSVGRQVYPAIEVVVVNAIGEGHPPIPEVCGGHPVKVCGGTRLSRSRAANAGLAQARGQWLIFLDDDDFFFPNHVSRLVGSLASCPEARVAYAGVQTVIAGKLGRLALDRPFDPNELAIGNYIPFHAVLFARTLIEEGAAFDEGFDAYEDWDFLLQLAQKTPFLHVEQISACYRSGGSSSAGLGADPSSQRLNREKVLTKWSHLLTPRVVSAVAVSADALEISPQESSEQAVVAAEAEAAELQRKLDGVMGSLSWKVTAPLRAVARFIRGAAKPVPDAGPEPPKGTGDLVLGSPPAVSAILPVFNAIRTDPRFLEDAVASVRRQTWGCSELIIVDDGSVDGTPELCRELAQRCFELPIRILRQENRGQSSARNTGARAARGEWLAFIDQDDRWTADHLKAMVPLAIDGAVNAVYSDVDLVGTVERKGIHRNHLMGGSHPKRSIEEIAVKDCFAPPGGMIIRRESFLGLGGFDESLSGYEDDDLLLRLVMAGPVGYVPTSTLLWRQHDTSYSQTERMVVSRERYWKKLLQGCASGNRRLRARISKRFFWVSLSQATDQLYKGGALSALNFASSRETIPMLSAGDRAMAVLVFLPAYRLARLFPALRRSLAAAFFRLARPWMW